MLEALASCFVCAPLPLYTSTPQSPIAFDPRWQLFHYPGYTIGAAAPCAAPLAQPRHLSPSPLFSPSLFASSSNTASFDNSHCPFSLSHLLSSLHPSSLSHCLVALAAVSNTHDQPSTHSLWPLASSIYPLLHATLALFLHATFIPSRKKAFAFFGTTHAPAPPSSRHRPLASFFAWASRSQFAPRSPNILSPFSICTWPCNLRRLCHLAHILRRHIFHPPQPFLRLQFFIHILRQLLPSQFAICVIFTLSCPRAMPRGLNLQPPP